MSVRSRRRYVTLAHADQPELTLRNVETPQIVPLYANFDRLVGTVRLRRELSGKIFAILEPDWATSEFGTEPAVFLGFEDCTDHIDEGAGIHYVEGGSVVSATIIDHGAWETIYGSHEAAMEDVEFEEGDDEPVA